MNGLRIRSITLILMDYKDEETDTNRMRSSHGPQLNRTKKHSTTPKQPHPKTVSHPRYHTLAYVHIIIIILR
jgi:hypothetical protein